MIGNLILINFYFHFVVHFVRVPRKEKIICYISLALHIGTMFFNYFLLILGKKAVLPFQKRRGYQQYAFLQISEAQGWIIS